MLLIVNAFLLVLVLDRENKSALYEAKAREETAAILARSGISIDVDKIPKDIELTAMTVPSDTDAEASQAAALVGEPAILNAGGAYIGPAGSTVRFYSDGAFSFLAAPGACPLDGTTPAKAAMEYLKKLQFTGEVLGLSEVEGIVTVTMQLYWGDVPVFASGKTVVTFQNDELHAIEGYRLTGTPVPEGSESALSVSTILLELLNHITSNSIVCSAITEVTEGYTLSTTQGSQPKLVPTWRIVTDTNPDGYYLNAVTGAVM